MLWITRPHVRVNRSATAWLVRRFADTLVARDDHDTLDRAAFVFDALDASVAERLASEPARRAP